MDSQTTITIEFIQKEGQNEWKKYITENKTIAEQMLRDKKLMAKRLTAFIAAKGMPHVPKNEYSFFGNSEAEPAEDTFVEKLVNICACSGNKTIKVGFYKNLFSQAIAYEDNGCIYFNTAKKRYGAGSPGNIAHEFMHVIGFAHSFRRTANRDKSIPYVIGDLVDIDDEDDDNIRIPSSADKIYLLQIQ